MHIKIIKKESSNDLLDSIQSNDMIKILNSDDIDLIGGKGRRKSKKKSSFFGSKR